MWGRHGGGNGWWAAIAAACLLGTAGCSAKNVPAKSGNELWDYHCERCHNSRSPSSYSDADWEVVMLHMRARANLTAKDHEAILEFLRSAN